MKFLLKYKFCFFIVVVLSFFTYEYAEGERRKYFEYMSADKEERDKMYNGYLSRSHELYFNSKNIDSVVSFPISSQRKQLDSILDNGSKLIFYFSSSNCDMCVQQELENIREFNKELKRNIILFVKADNNRYVSLFKMNNNINYPCFYIKGFNLNSLNLLDEAPFYFVLQKENLRINSAFLPNKKDKELTFDYYKKIISDYFDRKYYD